MARHLPTHLAALLAATLAALSACAAAAPAQDADVVAKAKSPLRWAKVLGSTVLVASDRRHPRPDRVQRVVDGRLVAAGGMTAGGRLVEVEHPGRDRAGRVVVPFARRTAGSPRARWYRYDAARDTARRVRGLPGGACTPTHLALWRGSTAYMLDCGRRSGVYLRDGDGTRRVSRRTARGFDDPLVLRGGRLVAVSGDLGGDFTLWLLAEGGETCRQRIEPSTGAADRPYGVMAVWLTGSRLSWWMESSGSGGNLVLGTDLRGDCATPEPAGAYAPTFERPLAIVGADRYATPDERTIVRRDAGEPSTAPPPNDAIADAEPIAYDPTRAFGVRIGFATRTADEPPVTGQAAGATTAEATRTVWYAYRPPMATRVSVSTIAEEPLGGTLGDGGLSVYDDPGTGALTELPKQPIEEGYTATFDADPAHRYLIGVGCDSPTACWAAVSLRLVEGVSASFGARRGR